MFMSLQMIPFYYYFECNIIVLGYLPVRFFLYSTLFDEIINENVVYL